jgi:hypothetical protein
MSIDVRSARSVRTMVMAPPAPASLEWQVFALFETGGRNVINEGRKDYDPARDLIVEPIRGNRHDARKVSVLLGADFVMSVAISKQLHIDGFGLFIGRRGNAHGFSWEWFDRADAKIFVKRQGNSRVAATLRRSFGGEELEAVEFLDDVALRYLDDITKPPGSHTHEVIVRRDSVFKLTA